MSTMKTREIRASLLKKGFHNSNNDHEFFHLYVHGKKTSIFTKISLGETECGDTLLGIMSRQLRLKRNQFDLLVGCKLTEEAYVEHLRRNQQISLGPSR